MALRWASTRELDAITKDVLSKWQDVMECLARDPMELDTRIDWVMKRALMEGFIERKSIDWADRSKVEFTS